MSDDVVTSADVAGKKVPTGWSDLKKPELLAAANAFGTSTEGNAKELVADLVEAGVTWEQYEKAFLVEPDEKEEPVVAEPPIAPPAPRPTNVIEEAPMTEQLVTKPAHEELAVTNKYLIKMTRDNPYFEHGGHKFTQEHPYAIMTAREAQDILQHEDGFRQAFPDELEEFYR